MAAAGLLPYLQGAGPCQRGRSVECVPNPYVRWYLIRIGPAVRSRSHVNGDIIGRRNSGGVLRRPFSEGWPRSG